MNLNFELKSITKRKNNRINNCFDKVFSTKARTQPLEHFESVTLESLI